MFYAKQDKATEPDSFTIRVRNVSSSAAQTAAQGVSSAAQSAASGINKGVYATRVWAAPRLENAANYTTTTVAPKVHSTLMSTAQQVRPVDVTVKKSRSMFTWSILAAAVVATAGAVAALVRYRYRTAMAEDEEDEFDAATGAAAPGMEGETQGSQAAAEASADTGVNGRVSTSGW